MRSNFAPFDCVLVALVLLAGCGDGATPGADAQPDAQPAADASGLGGGRACEQDSDCASGICWDAASTHEECGGKACSWSCTTSLECTEQAREAGALNPDGAICLADRCEIWNANIGDVSYWCN